MGAPQRKGLEPLSTRSKATEARLQQQLSQREGSWVSLLLTLLIWFWRTHLGMCHKLVHEDALLVRRPGPHAAFVLQLSHRVLNQAVVIGETGGLSGFVVYDLVRDVQALQDVTLQIVGGPFPSSAWCPAADSSLMEPLAGATDGLQRLRRDQQFPSVTTT